MTRTIKLCWTIMVALIVAAAPTVAQTPMRDVVGAVSTNG